MAEAPEQTRGRERTELTRHELAKWIRNTLLCALALLGADTIRNCNNSAARFIGKWEGEQGDPIEIERWENGKPNQTVNIGGDENAELLLPIKVNPISWGKGGIYRSKNGTLYFILFCEGGQHNVDIMIQGGGSQFKIGAPDQCHGWNEDAKTFSQMMMTYHPSACHSKNPKNWVIYKKH